MLETASPTPSATSTTPRPWPPARHLPYRVRDYPRDRPHQIQNQGGKTGDAGDLTTDQRAAFREVERLTADARRSARQAFPGDDVKLRSEFQVGINEPQDLASQLDRAGKTLVAARKYA